MRQIVYPLFLQKKKKYTNRLVISGQTNGRSVKWFHNLFLFYYPNCGHLLFYLENKR